MSLLGLMVGAEVLDTQQKQLGYQQLAAGDPEKAYISIYGDGSAGGIVLCFLGVGSILIGLALMASTTPGVGVFFIVVGVGFILLGARAIKKHKRRLQAFIDRYHREQEEAKKAKLKEEILAREQLKAELKAEILAEQKAQKNKNK